MTLKLTYDGDTLEECVLDGKALDWLKFLDNGCGTPCK